MSDTVLNILAFSFLALSGLFIALLAAPFEALGWWAGWFGSDFEADKPVKDRAFRYHSSAKQVRPEHFIVFLDGIAKLNDENYEDVQKLLDTLESSVSNAVVMGDVMPYAVTNQSLIKERLLSRFWRYAFERKLDNSDSLIGFTINLRNLFQVLVSADRRYGPVYHYAEAQLIIRNLLSQGYEPGSGCAVTLIGYSGGAQVALGVTPFLKHVLRAPVDLISLGGIMSADPGVLDVRFLYHVVGSKDPVEKLGAQVFPGRWPIFWRSYWNRAKRRGKFTLVPLNGIAHNSAGGYLDEGAFAEDGRSFFELTSETLRLIITNPEEVRNARVKQGALKFAYDPLATNTLTAPN